MRTDLTNLFQADEWAIFRPGGDARTEEFADLASLLLDILHLTATGEPRDAEEPDCDLYPTPLEVAGFLEEAAETIRYWTRSQPIT